MTCKFSINNISQKDLYFKLNSLFSIEKQKSETLVGIYAIYQNNICLYVGQSTNLASRIATHISGKYKESDYIYIIDIREIGFDDFEERNKESQKAILDNCEKYFIALLKPIENIIADFAFTLSKKETPNVDSYYLNYSFVIDLRQMEASEIIVSSIIEDTVLNIETLNINCFVKKLKLNPKIDTLYRQFFIPELELHNEI